MDAGRAARHPGSQSARAFCKDAFDRESELLHHYCHYTVVAYPIKKTGSRRLIAATYQAASGAGALAMEELVAATPRPY